MATLTIRKKGSTWEYRIYLGKIDGKTKRIARSGYKTKQAALNAGQQHMQEFLQPMPHSNQANMMTYGAYLDFWLQNYCQVNLKETTIFDYTKRINNVIKPHLGSYLLSSLTPMILQGFINDIFNEGYSRNAMSSMKGIITSSLRYAVSPAGFLSASPAVTMKLPHYRAKPRLPSRKKTRKPLTVDDWIKLIQRFPREHSSHIPLNLGYHLGLRLGEAFGLCWEDIDFEAGLVSIRRQVQYDDDRKCWYFTDPKYESFRTITMDQMLIDLLRDEYDRQQRARSYFGKRYHLIRIDADDHFSESGKEIHPVCIREDGSYIQPRTMQHTMHICHTELDLPLMDFHTLRHTHATMLLEAGASLLDIKERLGHTKIDMTELYTHNTDAIRRRTTALLNNIYREERPPV